MRLEYRNEVSNDHTHCEYHKHSPTITYHTVVKTLKRGLARHDNQ